LPVSDAGKRLLQYLYNILAQNRISFDKKLFYRFGDFVRANPPQLCFGFNFRIHKLFPGIITP
jgi:hypothetical protein